MKSSTTSVKTKTNKPKFSFDKELFKRSVLYNVKTLYRKELEEATPQQIFQAVSYAVKDQIVERWMETQKAYEKEDPKMVYYMSMEFLMGRALGNNMINLKGYQDVKEALEELGLDLNVIEDQEPDAALGNGGLGRLAACFLDSLATLGYAAYGCGIRYRYGMFKQKIKDGYQIEAPDDWLKDGNPFELRRPEYAKEVKFGGYVNCRMDENGRNVFYQEGYQSVRAIPYDLPIVGYGNGIVNTLRIWDAEPVECFSLDSFDKGDYQKAVEQANLARNIVEVLYPNDNHYAGKELRLKQQYCRGVFEATILCSSCEGRGDLYGSAFWIQGPHPYEEDKSLGGPGEGGAELDIMENWETDFVSSGIFVNGYDDSPELDNFLSVVRGLGNNYQDSFHTFTLIWDETLYRTYVDGRLVLATNYGLGTATVPEEVILSICLHRSNADPPAEGAEYNYETVVDSLRIWQKQ